MLKTATGCWTSAKEEIIQQELLNHFTNIYQAVQHSSGYWEELSSIQHLVPQITLEQQAELVKQVSKLEVKNVIFQMGSLKAPGPDGIPPIFYQKY